MEFDAEFYGNLQVVVRRYCQPPGEHFRLFSFHDRFGNEIAHLRLNTLLPVTLHGSGVHGNDWKWGHLVRRKGGGSEVLSARALHWGYVTCIFGLL